MVTVIARNYVKDEHIDEVLEITVPLIEATRKEDGCIAYELFQQTEDPSKFVFVETWTSKAALTAHMESDHFKAIVPQVKELCSREGEIQVFED